MNIRTLQRKGYEVKSSSVGHWVDGRCGYMVAGYFNTQAEAVTAATDRIAQAIINGAHPVWLIRL